jgi:YHS domain-containing protein
VKARRAVLASIAVTTALLTACGGGRAAPEATTPGGSAPAAQKSLVHLDEQGVALGGYDPVAYQTYGKPVTGTPEHATQHAGATYWFSSTSHVTTFDGATHVPLYGGYCAYAASLNRLSPADPRAFAIHDGQLFVFTNVELRDLFAQDVAGNKAKADANWPGLVAKHGR